MSLRTQILLGYGLVLALVAGVVAVALVNVRHLGAASEAILSENYRSIEAAETMADALERQDSAVLFALSHRGDAGARQFRANARRFGAGLAVARGNVTIGGEGSVVREIERTAEAYGRAVAEAGGAPTPADYRTRLLPAFQATKDAVTRLRDLNEATMVAASTRARGVARRAAASVLAAALATLALGLVLSVVLAGRITRPVRRMRTAAARIAAGDLDAAVPAGASDELGALAGAFNDMTARLRALRALDVERVVAEQQTSAAVIASVDDGLVVVRSDGTIHSLNPAAGVALGVAPEAAVGRPLDAVAHDARIPAHVRAVLDGAPTEAETARIVGTADGTRQVQVVASPVRMPDGTRLGAILLLRDVTALRTLDRLKSEFIATASHELKTPLTSMGMSVALLQEKTADRLTAREAELLASAAEDVERLTHLVRGLLDLSRIDAGRLDLALAPVDVAEMARTAVRGVALPAEAAGVAVTVDVPGDVPPVRVDAARIGWVLTNLLANALRFTPRGGHVRVSARRAGALVAVSVADDGEGIPADVRGRLFERFVQAPGEKAAGGSGLGLAIARETVEAHGGTIGVSSVPGAGATFTFTLPVA